jgi:hypothetical protein
MSDNFMHTLPLGQKNLAECPAKKPDQRTYAFLGERVIRRGWIEYDCQAVDQKVGGSTQIGGVEFAGSGAGLDYISDLSQEKFPKIADTFPISCNGKAQRLK